RVVQGRLVEVAEHELAALFGEGGGDAPARPAARARYQRHPVAVVSHGVVPSSPGPLGRRSAQYEVRGASKIFFGLRTSIASIWSSVTPRAFRAGRTCWLM